MNIKLIKCIRHLKVSAMLLTMLLCTLIFISCEKEELEIQQDFPFEISVMPVPKELAKGETVEIRMTIQKTGNYNDTHYYLRYFQFDGQGSLSYHDDQPYLPNDLYALDSEQFRLYYTSNSTVSQSFTVWISDNFGNEKEVSFDFNNSDTRPVFGLPFPIKKSKMQ